LTDELSGSGKMKKKANLIKFFLGRRLFHLKRNSEFFYIDFTLSINLEKAKAHIEKIKYVLRKIQKVTDVSHTDLTFQEFIILTLFYALEKFLCFMVKISSPFKEYFFHIKKTHNLGPDNFFHHRDPRQKFDLLILEMPKQKPEKTRASYFTFIEFYFMLKYFRLHRKSCTHPAKCEPGCFHKNFKS
jgi:hypothetical protein